MSSLRQVQSVVCILLVLLCVIGCKSGGDSIAPGFDDPVRADGNSDWESDTSSDPTSHHNYRPGEVSDISYMPDEVLVVLDNEFPVSRVTDFQDLSTPL